MIGFKTMTAKTQRLLDQLMDLSKIEKAEIIAALQKSFDVQVDEHIDEFWRKETKARIEAYKAGKIDAYPIDEAFKMLDKE